MPRAFSEGEKEKIRQRLIEQGFKQFSAYGLKKTNIDELAAAVGISKGAFYIFYDSKETLFMDVAEMAETHFRREVLATLDTPADSARARLFAVLKKAFTIWKTMPILQQFTGADVEILLRRLPEEKLRSHLQADNAFIEELVGRCIGAGIPLRVNSVEMSSLVYALLLISLNEDGLGPMKMEGSLDVLIELVAAYCVGEIDLKSASANGRQTGLNMEAQNVLVD